MTFQVKLSVDLVCRLRLLAKGSGSSLFVTVLAAFKVLLAKYSRRMTWWWVPQALGGTGWSCRAILLAALSA